MSGFFMERQPSLRARAQRFRGRSRYQLGFIHFVLELFQGGARSQRFFFLLFRLLLVGRPSDSSAAFPAEDHFVAADAGREVVVRADQLVTVVEEQADALLLTMTAARLDTAEVVPTIDVEGIDDQRAAYDEPHLASGHSGA